MNDIIDRLKRVALAKAPSMDLDRPLLEDDAFEEIKKLRAEINYLKREINTLESEIIVLESEIDTVEEK